MARRVKVSELRRAEDALKKWGSCPSQGELFTRRQLSKAESASSKDKKK